MISSNAQCIIKNEDTSPCHSGVAGVFTFDGTLELITLKLEVPRPLRLLLPDTQHPNKQNPPPCTHFALLSRAVQGTYKGRGWVSTATELNRLSSGHDGT